MKTKPARNAAPAVGRFAQGIISDLATRTKYVDPELARAWPSIAGDQLVSLCRPGRLMGGRVDCTLEVVAASSAAASRIAFEEAALRERANAYFGPGVVGRVRVRVGGDNGDENANTLKGLARFRAGD